MLALEVEKASNSPKERELELMKEIEELKKRLRDIEVLFEERKSFQLGYARSQRDRTKCFACGRMGISPGIAELKRTRFHQGRKFSKKQKFGKRDPELDRGESGSGRASSPSKEGDMRTITYGLELNTEGIISM